MNYSNEPPLIPLLAFVWKCIGALGLLDNIRIVQSSDPAFRSTACDISEFFVDVPYEGEIVRARYAGDKLQLHEGGDSFIDLPLTEFSKTQVSPTRDSRLRWMQSGTALHSLHCGRRRAGLLEQEEAPEIKFICRDPIDRSDEAYVETSRQ